MGFGFGWGSGKGTGTGFGFVISVQMPEQIDASPPAAAKVGYGWVGEWRLELSLVRDVLRVVCRI